MYIDTHNDDKIIITTAPGDEQIGLNELRARDISASYIKRLCGGVVLAKLHTERGAFTKIIKGRPPVFIRHIAPAWVHTGADDTDAIADSLHASMEDASFCVQARLFDGRNERTGSELQIKLSDSLKKRGKTFSKHAAQIVSVAVAEGEAYAGVSRAADNLNTRPGGIAQYRKTPQQISRSEYKLMEAADLFGLRFPEGGAALDLGASPGGWSRVLSGYGMDVIAVDPADLHASLYNDARVTHIRATAWEYLRSNKNAAFDVIVNDMKMDADLSIDTLVQALPLLKDGGFCVLTLKLAEKNKLKHAIRALGILGKYFDVLHARQLYNNRSEVTVILGKR